MRSLGVLAVVAAVVGCNGKSTAQPPTPPLQPAVTPRPDGPMPESTGQATVPDQGQQAGLDSERAAGGANPPGSDRLVSGGEINPRFDESNVLQGPLGHQTGVCGTTPPGSATGAGDPAGSVRSRRGPELSIGQLLVQGKVDPVLARRSINRNRQKLQYCYELRLLANPKLAGTVDVQLSIDVTGRVVSVSAKGVDDEVSGCVAGIVKSLEFPKPRGGKGASITCPLTFRPGEPDATRSP